MKALLRKELREFLPVGITGFVAASILCFIYAQLPTHPRGLHSGDTFSFLSILSGGAGLDFDTMPIPILNDEFQGLLSVLCILLGATLGGLLAWRETSAKTWAYLIHRPVTRKQIISAKLLTGSILYLMALGIPLGFLCVWCSLPGHYPAPWSWIYLYAVVDKLIIGLLYLAGIFLCYVRTKARWYGSRFLPAFAVIALCVLQNAWLNIITLLVATSLTGFLLIIAIHAAFVRKTALGRLALISIFTIGLTAFLVVISLLTATLATPAINALFPTPLKETFNSPHISADGAFQRIVEDRYDNHNYITDLNGTILKDNISYHDPDRLGMVGFYRRPASETCWNPLLRRPPVSVFSSGTENNLDVGYIFHPARLLMVYNWTRRTPIAFWGKDGICDSATEATPFTSIYSAGFEGDGWGEKPIKSEFYICSADGLYVVSASDGLLQLCPDAIADVATYPDLPPFTNYVLYARANHFIQVCGPMGENAMRYPLPLDIAACDSLQIRFLPDKTLGIIANYNYSSLKEQQPELPDTGYYTINTNGQVLRQATYDRPSTPEAIYHFVPFGMMSINPGATVLVMSAIILDRPSDERLGMLHSMKSDFLTLPYKKMLPFTITYWILCSMLTFVMLHRRGIAFASKIGWSLFALLGGLPALIAVRIIFLNEKAISCPSCGRKRQPSRLICPRCREEWPHPPTRDIDIIEPRLATTKS